jgi:hypothetical protein
MYNCFWLLIDKVEMLKDYNSSIYIWFESREGVWQKVIEGEVVHIIREFGQLCMDKSLTPPRNLLA